MKRPAKRSSKAPTKAETVSRNNRHYFYGTVALVGLIVLVRPDDAQQVLTVILNAAGGIGLMKLIQR